MKHIYYLVHYSHIPMQLCSYSQLMLGLKSKIQIWQNETSFWHSFEICIPCVGNEYHIIVWRISMLIYFIYKLCLLDTELHKWVNKNEATLLSKIQFWLKKVSCTLPNVTLIINHSALCYFYIHSLIYDKVKFAAWIRITV